jgi:light-regulated signal transduction histidine kinase (bacteriophytochrome)
MNIFSAMTQITNRLGSVTTTETLLDNVVDIVKDITRFHRVLVYRFDEKCNGRVVAERVNANSGLDSYLGLQFPASDIPAQVKKISFTFQVHEY